MDYRELGHAKDWLDATFDHRHLNDMVKFNPSAENLAKFIYDTLKGGIPRLASVTVKETPKTAATYYP
jgi:6-pyruvoyltetrahydropterin/6-carboxytetrahydropterin synthase